MKTMKRSAVSSQKSEPSPTRRGSPQLENLNHAIWITRESIHAHQEALRNLESKLTNQLAEFHRQATKGADL